MEERQNVLNNIPTFVNALPDQVEQDARYLSTFIAGTAVGLFDVALNDVWNEVVVNLRGKVVSYDLNMLIVKSIS